MENVVERALILSKGGLLTFDRVLSSNIEKQVDPAETSQEEQPRSLDEAILQAIRRTLTCTNGKVHGPGGAAELLQINPTTLRSRMKKLGIPFKGEK